MKNEIIELPITRIIADPDQPRKVFKEEELSGLADSIKMHGLLQPITVRRLVNGQKVELNADYMIITGERRFRAHQFLGKETIPAIVRKVNGGEVANLQAMENLAREDMLPTECAWAVDRGIKSGQTYEQLAKSFGRSASSLDDLHSILKLPGPILKRVDDGVYALGIAKMVAKFSPRLHLEAYDRTQGMTIEQAKKVLQIMAIEHRQMDIFTLSPEEVAVRNDVANQLWILRSAATTFFANSTDSLRTLLKEPDMKVLREIRDRADSLLEAVSAPAPETPKRSEDKPSPKTYDAATLKPVCDQWWKGARLADLARPLGLTHHQLLGQFWSTGLVPRPKPGKKVEYDEALAAANPYNKAKI